MYRHLFIVVLYPGKIYGHIRMTIDLWQYSIMLSHRETNLISHSVTLSWHWANQYLPYPSNAQFQARQRQVYIVKLLLWLDQGSNLTMSTFLWGSCLSGVYVSRMMYLKQGGMWPHGGIPPPSTHTPHTPDLHHTHLCPSVILISSRPSVLHTYIPHPAISRQLQRTSAVTAINTGCRR